MFQFLGHARAGFAGTEHYDAIEVVPEQVVILDMDSRLVDLDSSPDRRSRIGCRNASFADFEQLCTQIRIQPFHPRHTQHC